MAENPQAASTYGWDTAYGIKISDVNKIIASSKSSPTSFSAKGIDSFSGSAFTLTGTFSDWQICKGGAGNLLHMSIPIPKMSFTLPKKTYSFSNGEIIVEVDLHYVNSSKAQVKSGENKDLTLKSVVSIISSSFSEENYKDALKQDTENTLKTWLNNNITLFKHTFASVNVNRTADKGQFAWLLPTETSYAYVQDTGDSDGILGILCMTEGRSSEGLEQQLSPNIIPAGSDAGFLISRARFMQDLLLPSMPLAFKGTHQNDYKIDPENATITLTDQDVQLAPTEAKGKTYKPYLESLTVSVTDQELSIDSTSKTNILSQMCALTSALGALSGGTGSHSSKYDLAVWSFCKTNSSFNIELFRQDDGSNSLKYTLVGKPTTEHWTKKSEGMKIASIILDVIAVLATIVLGVLTDGAGFVIGAIVIGLLTGLANEIPNLIATVGTNDAPSIDLLVFNATDPIVWTDDKDFNLNFAGLNDSLQLGGNPGASG